MDGEEIFIHYYQKMIQSIESAQSTITTKYHINYHGRREWNGFAKCGFIWCLSGRFI